MKWTIQSALKDCANNPSEKAYKTLNEALDKATNRYGLQTAPTVISETDQLSGSKLQRKGLGSGLNANFGESKLMTNLVSKNSSKNQAHKGFNKHFAKGLKNQLKIEKKKSINRQKVHVNIPKRRIKKPNAPTSENE